MSFSDHTVEKIGGTSMSRVNELLDTLLIGKREGAALYNRVFVVSAFGGITDLLLEHKKSGRPGVYGLFANDDNDHGWLDALSAVGEAMREAHGKVLDHPGDISMADEFVRERIEGARSCLFDLQRLCSFGHFRLSGQMLVIRELLSGLGEAHSAFVTTLLLQRHGVNARFVDLSGWRDEAEHTLEERIVAAFDELDLTSEMPIVTGYAQCTEGLMREYDRGYSEVTFSNVAALTQAKEAIIHKEFHLSSADPGLVGVEKARKWVETETESMQVRGGDFPIDSSRLASLVLLGGIERSDRVQRFMTRAEQAAKEADEVDIAAAEADKTFQNDELDGLF